MSKIFIFRGKAATGKSVVTDLLSEKLNIVVLRKDDIYDKISSTILDHVENNRISYEILANIIQTNVDANCDIIIDIGLAHTSHLKEFLSKVNWANSTIYHFLCICSNNLLWRERINKRLKNPLPNQSVCSNVSEIEEHYRGYDITPLENEFIIDSTEKLHNIIDQVIKFIKQDEATL